MRQKGRILLFVTMLTLTGAAAVQAFEQWSANPLLKELLLAIAARDRMQQEYSSLLSAGGLSYRQSSDFAAYLGQLDSRIAIQCMEIANSRHGTDIEQLPCRAEAAPGRLSARLAAEKTPQEELAQLDASLASEIAEFDEKLLVEQQKVAARSARASESAGGGAGEGGEGDSKSRDTPEGAGTADSGTEGRDSSADSEAGEARPSSERRGAGGSITQQRRKGGESAPPQDIPDGSDDDVVARQLREAAQKESDPELKRRLWQEYRRYKASTK